MKNIVTVIFIIIFILFFPVCQINAEGEFESETQHINEALDDFSDGVMSENGISIDNADEIFKITPDKISVWLWENIKAEIKAPAKLLIILLSIIILSSVSENMYDLSGKSGVSITAGIVSVLTAVNVMTVYIEKCFTDSAELIEQGGDFMLAFVPVMSGVMASSGNITTAGSYSMIVLYVCEFAMQLAGSILVPLLSLCFSFSIIDSVNTSIALGGMITSVRKIVTLILGITATIFAGLLSIQSIAGSAADSLSVKTGKYLISNLVPVAGGAVSDAYSTLYGSLGILKNSIGTVGIAVIVITAAVPLIRLFLYRFVLSAASAAADMLSAARLKKLLSDIEGIFGMLISILMVFFGMLIISTVIIMKTGAVM